MILSKEFRFEASHQLQHDPGKCRRLHGHSWKLTVEVEGLRDNHGIVINYRDIKAAVDPMIEGLDHWHLGSHSHLDYNLGGSTLTSPVIRWWIDQAEFGSEDVGTWVRAAVWEPTSENLLYVFADWLSIHAPQLEWSTLSLSETCTCSASLTWEEYTIEVDLRAEREREKGELRNARQTLQQEGKRSNEEGTEEGRQEAS